MRGGGPEVATVKLFATLRKAAGEASYESGAGSVAEVLKEVEKRYGDGVKRYLKNCVVLVNGQNIGYLRGKRTRLGEEDEVSIFPPVAGG